MGNAASLFRSFDIYFWIFWIFVFLYCGQCVNELIQMLVCSNQFHHGRVQSHLVQCCAVGSSPVQSIPLYFLGLCFKPKSSSVPLFSRPGSELINFLLKVQSQSHVCSVRAQSKSRHAAAVWLQTIAGSLHASESWAGWLAGACPAPLLLFLICSSLRKQKR